MFIDIFNTDLPLSSGHVKEHLSLLHVPWGRNYPNVSLSEQQYKYYIRTLLLCDSCIGDVSSVNDGDIDEGSHHNEEVIHKS